MIQYRSERQAQLIIGITMFIFAFFGTAFVQLTAPILSYIVEEEGYTDQILSGMIVTICSLAQIPACLLTVCLGRRMNKKLWSYIGIACFLIGSLLMIPFSKNLAAVLLCRFVVGFGSGLLIVLYTAILPDFYEGKRLSMMMGIVTSGGGFWGFIFSNLQANLCGALGWKAAYMVHLYALIPLLLFFLLVPGKPFINAGGETAGQCGKAEEAAEDINKKRTAGSKSKAKLPGIVFLYALFGALLYMGIQVMWTNTSIWMRDSLGGSAAEVGLVSSFFSLFSCTVRLVFGPMFNRMGKKMIQVSLITLALGLFMGAGAQTFGAALIGGAMVGAAMGFTAPTCLNLAIQAAPEYQVAAQAICTIGFASGQFLSTYWQAFAGQFSGGSLADTFQITAWFTTGLLLLTLYRPLVRWLRRSAIQRSQNSFFKSSEKI